MSFIAELREKSANAENIKQEVIAEIKTYLNRTDSKSNSLELQILIY